MPKIYSIEGNIGSGKSTIVKYLNKNSRWLSHRKLIYLQEPIDTWESFNDGNENIIEKFYENQKEWAFSFQMMAYISRISQLKKLIEKYPHNSYIIITERCVETDKNVFAKMLYDDNKIHPINYKIYLKWFDEFVRDIPIEGYIYLKTKPEICHERIIKRDRKGETISLDYLKKCCEYHDSWLDTKENKLIIDVSQEKGEEVFQLWCNNIIDYIKTDIRKKNHKKYNDALEAVNYKIGQIGYNHYC